MVYDPYKRNAPDTPNLLMPPQEWVDMGDDQQQPIDFGPAAGAFKDRFMNPSAPVSTAGPMGHAAEAIPAMGHAAVDAPKAGHEAVAGAVKGKGGMNSL